METYNIANDDLAFVESPCLAIVSDSSVLENLANEREANAANLGLQDHGFDLLVACIVILQSQILDLEPVARARAAFFGLVVGTLQQVVQDGSILKEY